MSNLTKSSVQRAVEASKDCRDIGTNGRPKTLVNVGIDELESSVKEALHEGASLSFENINHMVGLKYKQMFFNHMNNRHKKVTLMYILTICVFPTKEFRSLTQIRSRECSILEESTLPHQDHWKRLHKPNIRNISIKFTCIGASIVSRGSCAMVRHFEGKT